ncbi:TPA: phage tail protein [Escherichia coli]
MAIKGLEQAVENLSRISRTAVPGAAAMAINRVASSAISQSVAQVARETKVRRKLVKERARLKNGRWHVMQRVAGKNRYPIDVVKIPMAVPLTTAFKQNIERIRRERLPKELGYALQHQLRMVIKR